MSTGPPTANELERTFGVFFVGYVAAMVGYGFTFFQTYVYYSRYSKDHWAIKLTVALLCMIDTAGSALISQALYYYLVDLFPYETGLVDATKTFTAEIGLAVVAKWIVQLFYAFRLWSLIRSPILPGAIALLSTAAFALGLDMTAELVNNSFLAHLGETGPKAVVAISQAFIFVSGLLTFLAMCYYLRPSQTPNVKPIEGWFDNLVAYTITRGSTATLVQLGFFITFLIAPDHLYWVPFHFVASKLFINSLLTMLNCRVVVRGRGYNEEQTVDSKKSSSYSGSSPARSHNTGVRFNVVDTKASLYHTNSSKGTHVFPLTTKQLSQPAINIEVSRTVEQSDGTKAYDLDNNSMNDEPVAKAEKGNLAV